MNSNYSYEELKTQPVADEIAAADHVKASYDKSRRVAVELAARIIVESGGGKFIGISYGQTFQIPDYVNFNSPKTGSTILLEINDRFTADTVRQAITESDAKFMAVGIDNSISADICE